MPDETKTMRRKIHQRKKLKITVIGVFMTAGI